MFNHSDLQRIIDALTPEQREMFDAIMGRYDRRCRDIQTRCHDMMADLSEDTKERLTAANLTELAEAFTG